MTEYGGDAFALGIPNGAKPVARIGPDKCTRNVRNNKTQTRATGGTEPRPPRSVSLYFRAKQLISSSAKTGCLHAM